MKKPQPIWALRRSYGYTEVLEITKLDANYYYGKTSSGRRTNGVRRDLIGTIFSDHAGAVAALGLVQKAIYSTEALFKEAEEMHRHARAKREEEIAKIMGLFEKPKAEEPAQ